MWRGRLDSPMSLTPGTRIGHYTVVGSIGAGGMGEVYRARDTKLNREVAVKVLPPGFARDAERVARFRREAQVLAALNHPNIAAIFGLEEEDDVLALALEYVEGDDLAERLRRGPVPLETALAVAAQIAEALEAAHERGIVHRDLKPANVKLRPDGTVKVLDFGLAKGLASDTAGSDSAASPTITSGHTRAGVILGTAAYMSPEQARGKPVDRRTDIWALGCVLFEMLSARPTFAGETVSDTISNVLQREPDWTALPASTPGRVRRLLGRCLEKDQRRRLRDAGDARLEIEDIAAGRDSGEPTEDRAGRAGWRAALPSLIGVALAAASATAGLGLAALRWTTPDPAPSFSRFTRLVATAAHEFAPAISPDGKWVAYLSSAGGRTDLWVKFVAGGDAVNLTASSGLEVQAQNAQSGLEISPDGGLVAFTAGPSGATPVHMSTWVIPAPLGGVPRRLLNGGDQGLRWSPDGTRVAFMRAGGAAGDALLVADADGQHARVIVEPQGGQHVHWPRWSFDGRHVYFNYGFSTLNAEPTEIFRVDATGGPIEPVVRTARRAIAPLPDPSGSGLFYAANPDTVELNLWWRHLRSLRDVRLTSGIGEYGEPSISSDGSRLVGVVYEVRESIRRVPVAFDRPVTLEPVTDGFSGDVDPAVSPRGDRIVFGSSRAGSRNLWSARLDLTHVAPLTSGIALDERPAFSPDGREVAFVSDRGGRRGLWVVGADGGTPRLVGAADAYDTISWSPDGGRLAYARAGGDAPHLELMSVADGTTTPLATPAGASAPAWSPHADTIAYLEPIRERGTFVRFVRPNGQVVKARPGQAEEPSFSNGVLAWSPDGRRLAAASVSGNRPGAIWIMEPDGAPPRKLIDLPAGVLVRGLTWTPDGAALLIGHVQRTGDIVMADRAR